MKKSMAIRRRNGPYHLPNDKKKEGWFYTNTGSVDLVVHDGTKSTVFRLRVRDLKMIVEAMERPA